ncbi:NfeD family protein [Parabacteroides sp. FAFU027]|uniref:NfeD family protein n=1 Tax=Parabacteroides sp. FAFU027 TaxID=2922715 RepID=UPI001FAFFBAF|nr:NfeD family protein [Parabacteroides sp. FAFU027]
MKKVIVCLSLLLFVFSSQLIEAKRPLIYKINFKDEVGSKTWIYVKEGFKEARQRKADAIIIEMNTYGGTVIHADSIRTLILNAPIPTYVFINNNAASAGALIAIACDSIYMRPGANVGAATVVNETGQPMPDKYQSYMRAIIRSTAEAHGKDTIKMNGGKVVKWHRNPRIAEAMVDESIVVPGVVDSGKVLTLTAQEAMKLGFCDAIVSNIDEIVIDRLGYDDYDLVVFRPTVWDDVKGFLMNPALQAVLIMLIIGGIYFEMQAPGIGFPTIISLTAAVLYFAPLYIDGVAEYWEIILFVVGCLLLLAEIFIIPGFGIAGVTGIILVFLGLFFGLVNNVDFTFDSAPSDESSRAILVIISGLTLGIALIIYMSSRIGTRGVFSKFALQKTQELQDGYISVPGEYSQLIGKEGVAETILRPSGKIRIDGVQYDAVALTSYLDKGENVRVVKFENAQLYVKKK